MSLNKPKKFRFYILMAVGLSLASINGTAQTQKLNIEHIPGTNGISLGKINAIAQDNLGFMWLSDQSNGAIVRYDGSYMKQYKHDPLNPNSLGGSYPECLFATDSGMIWIGFYGQGLDCFDPRNNTFTHYRHDPDDPESLINDVVSAVLVDHLGKVWIGTDKGLDQLDPVTGKFTHYRYDEKDSSSLSNDMVRMLYEDKQGILWVGTGFAFDQSTKAGGLNRFDRKTGSFKRYLHDPENPRSLISNKVRAILEDSHGNFWVGTDGDGLHSMDRETGQFTRHTFDPKQPEKLSRPALIADWDHITFLIEDKAGKIWIGTESGGLNRFDPVTKSVTHFGKKTIDFHSLIDNAGWKAFTESNSGWCAYAADDGLIWLSTQNYSKLFKIDIYNNDIPLYSDEGVVISFFEESANVFWKATVNGLVRENLVEGTSKTYLHDPGDPKSISHNSIISISKDHLGQLWIGTYGGLNKFEPATGNFTNYLPDPNDPAAISSAVANIIYEDSNTNLWIGTAGGGLNLMDRNTGGFQKYINNPKNELSLSGDDVSTIIEDKQGTLWIGVVRDGGGVNQFQPLTQTFRRYLTGLSVINLLVDDNGVLWAGTANGLYRYHPDTDRFENTNLTSSITEVMNDSNNNLWLYSARGILRYDQQSGNTMLYDEKNGVQGILELAQYAAPYRKTDGTILFGGYIGGYYAFDPEKLRVSRDTSLLYFTDFRIQGESTVAGSGNISGGSSFVDSVVTLGHKQNAFTIQFTSIDYRNSQDNQISYMLENYDLNWLQADVEDPVNYYKVPPGEYTFRIKAANSSSGIWSEKSIQIVILPPWWATWWAYSIYGFLFVIAVMATHRFQKARVIRKERERIKDRELAQAREIEKAYAELKTTQAQLIQSEKMASLGELTAGIAHEIKNPLNFVNNFSEVNKELLGELKEELEKGNTKEVKALMKDVINNEEKIIFHGKRADSIVRGMLQHSRSSNGVKEPTDINALCDEYLRLAYHGLRAKDKSFNASMETDFDKSIGTINIIPQDIGRVVLNLLTNAFYAVNEKSSKAKAPEKTKYEPTVSISTKKIGKKVEIRVRDNGNGIPEKAKEKIFQPFFTTKPTGQGTGLGLSMSYDIVTKGHGGKLNVESEEGKGTTFTISLPA